MTLTDEQLAEARAAVLNLLDLSGRTKFLSGAWVPMRNGGIVVFGPGGSDPNFEGSPAELAVDLIDYLTNDLSETDEFWGVAFPHCPGHLHPASYEAVEDAVVLRCPTSGDEIRRVTV